MKYLYRGCVFKSRYVGTRVFLHIHDPPFALFRERGGILSMFLSSGPHAQRNAKSSSKSEVAHGQV